jgi:hypothetical protein
LKVAPYPPRNQKDYSVGVGEVSGDGVGDGEVSGDGLGSGEVSGDGIGLGEVSGDGHGDGVGVGDGDRLRLGVGEGVGEGVCVAKLKPSSSRTAALSPRIADSDAIATIVPRPISSTLLINFDLIVSSRVRKFHWLVGIIDARP